MSSGDEGKITFFFDENVNRDMAPMLLRAGHSVVYSVDVLAAGTPDQMVADVALTSSFVLVTHDKDFKKLERLLGSVDLGKVAKGAGKLQLLKIDEISAIDRVSDNLDRIEFEYARCLKRGIPFFMSISKTVVRMNDKP